MDFVRRIRKKPYETTNVESLEQSYKYNIKFYYNPPIRDVTLHLLEDIVVERLKVFLILERTSGKAANGNSTVEWKQSVLDEFKSEKLFGYLRLVEGDSNVDEEALVLARERDYISHFVLRFYYCDSDILKQWFVDREIELFRLKFSSLSSIEVRNFLKDNELNYVPVNTCEVKQIYSEINEVGCADQQVIVEFYKVPFSEVLNLVSSRQCILKHGYAYVNHLDSIIETIYRKYIEAGLWSTCRVIKEIKQDARIVELLKIIHRLQPGNQSVPYDQTHNFLDSIDHLSEKSFPLCARMCHELLREKHHLKYFSRNQYQLFLKGIGVSLEDSLKFWIEEFTHDNKEKPLASKYRYQIEYNYGKRGSKIDVQPPTCSDLLAMNHPSFQQCYGCPYKFMESSSLKVKLLSHGLSSVQVEEVLNYSSKNDYQLACTKYLEIVHDYKPNEVISNPNRYFELCEMVSKIRTKQASDTFTENKSNEESMYDKHLWEMLSPAKENLEEPSLHFGADFMSQLDLNY